MACLTGLLVYPDDEGDSARGDGGGSDSPSSVSSRFLDEVVGSSGSDPEAPDTTGDRIFLVKGGVRVDGSPFEPDGQGVVVSDWAPYVASLYASAYGAREHLEWRVSRTHIVRDVEDSRLIRAGVSLRNERVYYGKRSSLDDFFYMYVNVFSQLFVRVPFTKFQMVVLREANVALAQLHPNSWAAVQAFLAMCLVVGVTPTIPVFFHYFEVCPPPSGGWVSFTSVREKTLFCPFSDSFKNFKHRYFKIIIDATGRHEFHDDEGNPLFPFYWTREPQKIRAFPVGVLSPADLEVVRTINALPRRISTRHLVECFSLEDFGQKAFVVHVDPSSEATSASVAPLVHKRKDPASEGHRDKEASSSRLASKKARKGKGKEKEKEKRPSVPLSGVGDDQRHARDVDLTASLAWYLKEFADRPRVEEVRAELVAEKKSSASLQSTMEQLILNQDEYDKRIEQLKADLEKYKREAADADDRLAVVRGDHERLQEECSQLKIKASLLAGIQESLALGFDIEKDVFDGVLVDLNSMVDDEETGNGGPSGVAGAAEAVEVVGDEEEDGGDH
ncbi:hypothetical protein LR48_Vigan11g097100 [Vigna angularis]|uniref:Transposase (putative) gypsy type domain-containing protein n=1 Tax=Phaseolus angularis TaxID=3914 RepID=A0A0L9VSN9_PHAAN|nr:hypothetical protein LR48_Vigan11g097100 [Vigna angularis]